ncbi:SH2 domain-containing protein 2A [Pseudophryne corroboree]|uniref:SH2 domain-containing protein 2A n=1 Tax=Pseudophryne corroboree TaxID=495146 RepID=UPI003081B3D4
MVLWSCLSSRGAERCRHFILNQKDDEQYVIEGEESTHPRLEDLIQHYSRCPVEPYKELLTVPCGKDPRTHGIPTLGPPDSPTNAAAGGHSEVLPDTAPLLSTSPKEKGKAAFGENILVEYASSFVEKEAMPSAGVHEVLSGAYTSVTKPSRDPTGSKSKEPSPGPSYTSPELHTYTEPELWTKQGDSFDNTHDPIAFYAIGRGSCSESMENVYSEVDINSMALHDSKANRYRQVGFATVPHPSRQAFQHRITAHHSSLRMHKQPDAPQEDRGKGQGMSSKHFPKSKTKPQVPVQFDDPAYGKRAICHTKPPLFLLLDDQENVYEKIPENCPVNPKKSHSAKKES